MRKGYESRELDEDELKHPKVYSSFSMPCDIEA